MALQPDCLLQVGLIAHALWKGGLSDHTSLHHFSLHMPVGLLHSQQMFNFVPISITNQPKKRNLLKMKSQSREKRSNYSSLERHVALLGHQGAWRGCKCRRGLKCVGCSSVQWIIHQGTWLVKLKTVLRGQILLPVKHSFTFCHSYADWNHGRASLPSPASPLHWVHIHPEDAPHLLSFV